MRKYAFGLLIAAMSLQTTVAMAFGFGGCCDDCSCGRNFDGLYIGGNLGALTHTAFRQDFDGFLAGRSGWTSIATAFTGGAQIGYDYECDGSVFGLVWDFSGSLADGRVPNAPNDGGTMGFIRNRYHWFSTLRGRAGVTVCDALLYITGGLAVENVRTRWTRGPDFFNYKQTRYGWAIGVGSEFVGCDNWTFGFDLISMQFDNKHRTFKNTSGTAFTGGHSDQVWMGRFLFNYRFEELFCCW